MFDVSDFFTPPENEESKIWRYMNLAKFISLLSTESLYFCNSTCFDDKHEGSYTKVNLEMQDDINHIAPIDDYTNKIRKQNEIYRHNVHINCWHLSQYESDGMWRNYLKGELGIAVRSTYFRLTKSLDQASQMVFVGKLNYIDYKHDFIPYDQGLWAPFLSKRQNFEYEKELRAMYLLGYNLPESYGNKRYGDLVKVDIRELVEAIVVCPSAQNWFVDVVKSVIEKYGCDFKVELSEMTKKPIF